MAVLSMPRPKAQPEYFSGSMLTFLRTGGSTTPPPNSCFHPGPPFAHQRPFPLAEQGQVSRVDGFPPVNLAGDDDADGGFAFLHDADLHRRSVSPEQEVIAEVEGVPAVPRRRG